MTCSFFSCILWPVILFFLLHNMTFLVSATFYELASAHFEQASGSAK